jgi:hypothetical protein
MVQTARLRNQPLLVPRGNEMRKSADIKKLALADGETEQS